MSGASERPVFVLAIGDSLTAGYGLAQHQAFPAQLEARLRRHHDGAVVQNAGISGDTSASALARLPRLLSSLRRFRLPPAALTFAFLFPPSFRWFAALG